MPTFKPGVSGNTTVPRGLGQAGRLRAAIADDIAPIIAVVTAKALAGDLVACGLLLARAVPPLKPSDPATAVKLGTGTLTMQARRLTKLMASGDLPMTQGIDMVSTLSTIAKMRTLDELTATVDTMQKELEDIRRAITENKNR